ncbi:MAG: DUF393 domain-containing protein, partial [Mariniphaga sp.]|nr:DUF393 domain-containing protein [Mariniphaga sp.]
MYPIILFDGYCNLCNTSVNFIIRLDKKKRFRFASLQSATGKKFKKRYSISEKTDSVILIYNNGYLIESDAGIKILNLLGFPW